MEIDKLWFKFYSQHFVYDLARIEFLKRTEFTHFLLLTDDCLIQQKDIDQLIQDYKDTGHDVISGWFNQDLTTHATDTNFSFTLPPEPSPNHKYDEFNFEPIEAIDSYHFPYNPIEPVLHQGTALSLISRKVIEQVPFRHFNGICQDACLSIDLAKKGIKQYVDLRVKALHLKINDWMQWAISEVGKEKAEMVFEPKGTYRINDSLMYLDKNDSLHLKKNRIYEPIETELIKKILKPNDVVFDIGANIGYFTLLMARLCDTVYAFEPETRNFEFLEKNIKLNNLDNVIPTQSAVAASSGSKLLFRCDTDNGMHRLYESKFCNDPAPLAVRTVGLDDEFRGYRVEFIKMDIEGAEMGALKGMRYLLANCKPIILMEFHPPSIREYGADPEEEYHFLKTLGYDIRLMPDSQHSISYEQLEKETTEQSGRNIYCVPQGEKSL